ncbi:hypothetical protein [Arthrobacter sp. H14]|uniref:hypothetical protein n=1 Tax=Arthrobacter sp. H14 TaxID=1312959 RepID=UPI00047E3C32|nr:hypothetical protein [Arthrobacter sp. H14]
MSITTARQPKGTPAGGRFASAHHAEPAVGLTAAAIHVPSDPALYRQVFADNPSNAERRDFAREALTQALDGDDFDQVFTAEQKDQIRAEAERDDSTDTALLRVALRETRPHQFGSVLAGDLYRSRQERTAVEKHYVPSSSDTFHAAAVHIPGGTADYRRALGENFPHVGVAHIETMLHNQRMQPEGWQRQQLGKVAIMNERMAAGKAERPEVPESENRHFTSHPVTALESDIDHAILAGADVEDDIIVDEFHRSTGSGYGTLNIKTLIGMRMAAQRFPHQQ